MREGSAGNERENGKVSFVETVAQGGMCFSGWPYLPAVHPETGFRSQQELGRVRAFREADYFCIDRDEWSPHLHAAKCLCVA